MDPVTAGLNLATAIVTLIAKVWDSTPEAQKAIGAAEAQRRGSQMIGSRF